LEDELTENEQKELSRKIKYYSDMVVGLFSTLRFEIADTSTIGFLTDSIHFILFDRSVDFTVYVEGYDGQPGLLITDRGIEQIGDFNSLYAAIRIKSTQGEVFTLDDYYNACLSFWYKVK
jgi:hypothetical protein